MNPTRIVLLPVLLSMLVACGDSTGPAGEHDLRVQVIASPGSSAGLIGGPASAPGITALEINEAYLVLGGLKLETAGLDATVDWIFEESVVIPLDLSGTPVTIWWSRDFGSAPLPRRKIPSRLAFSTRVSFWQPTRGRTRERRRKSRITAYELAPRRRVVTAPPNDSTEKVIVSTAEWTGAARRSRRTTCSPDGAATT